MVEPVGITLLILYGLFVLYFTAVDYIVPVYFNREETVLEPNLNTRPSVFIVKGNIERELFLDV